MEEGDWVGEEPNHKTARKPWASINHSILSAVAPLHCPEIVTFSSCREVQYIDPWYYTLQRKTHLCIPRKGIAWPQSRFQIHVSVSDLYIYSQDRSTYFPAAGSWECTYKSLTDTWMWTLGLRPRNSISFQGLFVSSFRYCVVVVKKLPILY